MWLRLWVVVVLRCSFLYVGNVRGQGRPRFRRKGKPYEDAKDTEYKKALADLYKDGEGDGMPFYHVFDGPISVTIDVMRHLPKTNNEKRARLLRRLVELLPDWDTYKPDIDNIAKGVLDALNNLAWHDDKQIVCLTVRKYPRVWFDDELDRMRVIIADVDPETIYPTEWGKE